MTAKTQDAQRQGKLPSRNFSSGAERLTPSFSSKLVFSSPDMLITPVGMILVHFLGHDHVERLCDD